MKFIFKIFKVVVIFLFVIILAYVALIIFDLNISKGVNKAKILSLNIGMSKEKITEILGKPIKITKYGKDYQENDVAIYHYSKSNFSNSGLEINIEFSNKKLSGIAIELEDEAIYWCYQGYKNSCPKIISPFLWKYLIPDD